MKDKSKTIFIVILIIAIAAGLTWFSYEMIEPKESNESNSNITQNETTANIQENNVSSSNVQENKQEKEKENKQESVVQTTTNNSEDKKQEEVKTEKTTGETNEEKAINAVKKAWGSEEGVYFASMGIDSKGRYIVTVNDSATSAVYGWYNVNIQTGEVEAQ